MTDDLFAIQGLDETRIAGADGRVVARFPAFCSASVIPGTTRVLLASSLELDEIDAATGATARRVYALSEEQSDDLVAVRALSAQRQCCGPASAACCSSTSAPTRSCAHPRADPDTGRAGTLLAHPDGRRVLAFMADRPDDIFVWDTQDGHSLVLDGSDRVQSVAIAPDGRHLAITTAHALAIVDLETGETLSERDAIAPAARVLWLPGSTQEPTPALLLATSNDLQIFDARGHELLSHTRLPEPAQALAAAPGGLVLVAGRITVGAWQLGSGPRRFATAGSAYTSVLLEPSRGEALVSGWGLPPQRWDLATGRFCGPFSLAGHSHPLRGEFIALALPTLFLYRNESIELLDTTTGNIRGGVHDHALDGGHLLVRHISEARTRLLYARPPHAALRVAELPSGAMRIVNAGDDLSLADAAFLDPEGATIVSGHLDGSVRLWDAATRTLTRTISSQSPVSRLVTGRGAIYIGHCDGRVSALDAATGATLHAWPAHSTAVLGLAFDPASGVLATASTESVRVWRLEPGPALLCDEPTKTPPRGLTIAPNSVLFLEDGYLVILTAVPAAS
ncbi:WD40 repeat domain-containing protein [Nannocystis pusilla]|uniref:WD40 repeat domain-containing protein n=1 Tax=Nannocystis pusilla TaxID=889268 RepID=UPI003B7B3D6D